MAVLAMVTPAGPVPLEPAGPAEQPRTAALTLYESEEMLTALVDTMDIVPADQEDDLVARIGEAMITAVDKRDRMGRFLAHMDSQVSFAEAEIKRIEQRKVMFERVIERVEGYIVRIIKAQGLDEKKKWKKLEGKTTSFSIRKLPASVAIDDEAAVPSSCRKAVVKLAAPLWEQILDGLDMELAGRVLDEAKRSDEIMKTPIKEAIESGAQVPGAHLVSDGVKLVRS